MSSNVHWQLVPKINRLRVVAIQDDSDAKWFDTFIKISSIALNHEVNNNYKT